MPGRIHPAAFHHIRGQLRATGSAQVLVIVRPGSHPPGRPPSASFAPGADDLRRYFIPPPSADRSLRHAEAAGPDMAFYPRLQVILGTVDRAGFEALRRDRGRVASIHAAPALSLIRPRRIAAARLAGRATWGIDFLGVPDLWKAGLTGRGVLVSHLDTGADARHAALRTAIEHFAVFDARGRQVKPAPGPHDTDEHGTHTAATIAGRPVGGKAVGVAPGARIASAVVIEGGNTLARVLGGMDWAVGLGARVLSMSLGFRGWWEDFLPLTRILRSRNVLPVFASGNEGPGTSRSPGNYAEALSVGAADRRGLVAGFSSSQAFKRKLDPLVPDLVAPGVGVISARPGGGYQSMDGTSMATPHIAGLAALLWEARRDATVEQIEAAIFQSCSLEGGQVPERAGRGIPSATRALAALEHPSAPVPGPARWTPRPKRSA